jgi:O-antigen/teichoic acid export membrane protein
MKEVTTNFLIKNNTLINFFKKLSYTALIEIVVKAISFGSGILIIRLLPIAEYGLYTLANTMLGSMAVLADGGIGTGVLSLGGQVYKDKKRLGNIVRVGLKLRRKFGIICFIIMAPIVYFLMLKNGASMLMAFLICLSMVPAFFAGLSAKLFEISPKLHQDLIPLQKINVGTNLLRFLINLLTLFIFPFAGVAVLASGISQFIANKKLKKLSGKYTDFDVLEQSKITAAMLKITKRVLPQAIYFSLSGQLIVWFLAIFGDVKNVAELGALSRISMIFGLVSTVFSLSVVPKFAVIPKDKKLLIKRFLQIQIVLILMGASVPIIISFFPTEILWILGSEYNGLSTELIILGGTIGLNFIYTGLHGLNNSRAYILHPAVFIPLNFIVSIGLIIVVDPSTTANALMYELYRGLLGPILFNAIFFYFTIKTVTK